MRKQPPPGKYAEKGNPPLKISREAQRKKNGFLNRIQRENTTKLTKNSYVTGFQVKAQIGTKVVGIDVSAR